MINSIEHNFTILPITSTSSKFEDLTGQTFNRLTVLGYAGKFGKNQRNYWVCSCECGKFKTILGKDLKNGKTKSCTCLKSELQSEKTKWTHEKFLKQYCSKFPKSDLTIKGIYDGAEKHILVQNKYGECLITPSCMFRGQTPTIKSALDKNSYFKNQAIEIHGDKYIYDLVEYINSNTKIKIICRENGHGVFEQTPDKHLQKQGCYECGRKISSGWSRSDFIRFAKNGESILYIIRCWNEFEEFYKIGITVQKMCQRFNHKGKMPYNYEIVKKFSDAPSHIFDLENTFLAEFKSYKYQPQIKFEGHTECFNLNLPISEINNNEK